MHATHVSMAHRNLSIFGIKTLAGQNSVRRSTEAGATGTQVGCSSAFTIGVGGGGGRPGVGVGVLPDTLARAPPPGFCTPNPWQRGNRTLERPH